jgi:hypothetical protein
MSRLKGALRRLGDLPPGPAGSASCGAAFVAPRTMRGGTAMKIVTDRCEHGIPFASPLLSGAFVGPEAGRALRSRGQRVVEGAAVAISCVLPIYSAIESAKFCTTRPCRFAACLCRTGRRRPAIHDYRH